MFIVPDFSHHQANNLLAEEFMKTSNTPMIILKATEGVSFKDSKLEEFATYFLNRMKDCGALPITTLGLYHFCRLDSKGSNESASVRAWKEMEHFRTAIERLSHKILLNYGIPIRLIPILDWETGANTHHEDAPDYLCACVRYFHEKCGTGVVLYTSSSITNSKACKALYKEYPDTPLWVAHYNTGTPRVYTWNNWAAWQYTSTPFDLSFVKLELFCNKSMIWGDN